MTGTFTLPGRLDVPFVYAVRRTRDGKVYCTRTVDARQDGDVCFTCVCSFKRDEKKQAFGHQPETAQQRYKSVLDGKRPEDHPASPSVDADWWIEHVEEGSITEKEFPGADVRKVDMNGYNDAKEIKQNPEKYRQLSFYSIKGSPEYPATSRDILDLKTRDQSGEFDNLYICAHLYSSDKNSIPLIPRALGNTNFIALASLTLTVIIHQHEEALRMIDWGSVASDDAKDLPKKWFLQEAWTSRSGGNRAVHESWLWNPNGALLATTLQDCLLRYPSEEKL